LTAKRSEDRHRGLAENPPLARSTPGKKPNHRKADNSPDRIRRRRATASRARWQPCAPHLFLAGEPEKREY